MATAATPATTTHCDAYSEVSCTSTNPAISLDALQMASDTREQLTPLLKLGKNWRFPVHITIVTPNDPLSVKVRRESVSVIASNGKLKIEAFAPSSSPDLHAFIQREYVVALLWEKFFAPGQTFDTHTRIDVVPVWLIEGAREWLNEDPEHNREAVVRRASMAKRAPTVEEIAGWHELSEDSIMRLWQGAFSYYLFDGLIRSGAQRQALQDWLAAVAKPNAPSIQTLLPSEAAWQQELASSSARSRDIVYSWDETVAELAAAETIAIPGAKAADTRLCTIDTVSTFPRSQQTISAVQQKILNLTALELRAHPSWRPIIATYRFGLTSFTGGKNPDDATKLIAEAQRRRTAEMAAHQKLLDYANWFEVTKDYASGNSSFSGYFTTAREIEQAEADPDHPNPIRADLLQVESKL